MPDAIRGFNLLPACSWFLLENLTVSQPIKKSPAVYGSPIFISTFASPQIRSHPCSTEIHSLSYFPLHEHPFQYHSLNYTRVFQWLFLSSIATNKIHTLLNCPIRAIWSAKFLLLDLITRKIFIVL